MIHKMIVEIDTESREQANTIAVDIEQVLSLEVFAHREHVKVRAIQGPDEDDERLIELARQRWQRDGEIEIDSDAIVSQGDDPGAYVAAWVWVDDPTADQAP